MGIRNVGAILKTLASWVAAEGFRMTEPLIHAVVRQLVHRADFEMVDEGLQMLSIEPVGAGLNVFAGQECLHRDTDFFSPDRLPGANLGGLNGHLAGVLLGERPAGAGRLRLGVAAAVFIAPATVPFMTAPKRPMRRISHEGAL